MENEQASRNYRGEIKQFVKNKGQVIASGGILAGLSIFGMCEASNADNSSDDEYQDFSSTQLVEESFAQAESYQSFVDRIMEESKENVDQMEQEMQTDEEFDLETPTPTATSTPTPTMTPTLTPTPIPPTPTPEPYIPTPTPTPDVSPQSQSSSNVPSNCPELIADTFGWSGCAISYCESGWDQNETGDAGERGWFQIHPIHSDSTYDPVGNVAAANRISNGGTDWGAWSVRGVLSNGGFCPNGEAVPSR